MRHLAMILIILALMAGQGIPAAGQPGQQAPPCSQPEARQFDFWVGSWDVHAKGKIVGRNQITSIQGGCTLLEDYHALGSPYAGMSFNYHDPTDGNWHQLWVDNGGLRLHLSGGLIAGKMVMAGDRLANGKTVTDRITWTDNGNGTVRQLWEQSGDGGESWQVLFDGHYQPAEPE